MKKRARVIEQDRQSCWTTLLSGIYSNVRQVRSNERKRKFKKKGNLMESRKSKSRNVTGSADGTEELARDGQMEKKRKKAFPSYRALVKT